MADTLITVAAVAHYDLYGMGQVRLYSGRTLGYLRYDPQQKRYGTIPYVGDWSIRGGDRYQYTTAEDALQALINVTNRHDAKRMATKVPRQWGQRRIGKRGGRRGKGYEGEAD